MDTNLYENIHIGISCNDQTNDKIYSFKILLFKEAVNEVTS